MTPSKMIIALMKRKLPRILRRYLCIILYVVLITVVLMWNFLAHFKLKTLKSTSPQLPMETKQIPPKPMDTFTQFKSQTFSLNESHKRQVDQSNRISVAIGCAITTKGIFDNQLTSAIVKDRQPLFQSLLPTFCKTASENISYRFYVAHDLDDPYFVQNNSCNDFVQMFRDSLRQTCSKPSIDVSALTIVKCFHSGKPAWAQNDAMMAAYKDNATYFYRVNDDTQMLTPDWTKTFIKRLVTFHPPNVGVVGPKQYEGLNLQLQLFKKSSNMNEQKILTYDFVHRTHMDIFGFYYPRIFTDWFADSWISKVYSPERCLIVTNITVWHTLERGVRYKIHRELGGFLEDQVQHDKTIIQNWISNNES